MSVSEIPVTAYATPTQIIIQAAQDEVIALVNQFKALLPDPESDSGTAGSPDYDAIRPEIAVNMRAELDALIAAVDAAPVV